MDVIAARISRESCSHFRRAHEAEKASQAARITIRYSGACRGRGHQAREGGDRRGQVGLGTEEARVGALLRAEMDLYDERELPDMMSASEGGGGHRKADIVREVA